MLSGRVLCWFSCGVASAVAAKLTAALYANKATVELIYCNTAKDEHPDNARFRADVEKWVGLPVKIIGSKLYETTDEVFAATKYMSGIGGARCTTELKKIPRFAYQWAEDTHVFGMTVDEAKRIQSFEEENHELDCEWPLRDAGWTKQDCHEYVKSAGIEIPVMYRLGFENNNCIGCVKATSPAYWNLTRKNFPDRYRQRAEQSRELGVRLVRYKGVRIFLDELPEDATEKITEDLSCGPQCGSVVTPEAAQRFKHLLESAKARARMENDKVSYHADNAGGAHGKDTK